MRDYVVEVLYQDCHNNTQQELFEVSAKSKQAAQDAIINILNNEGSTITYIKCN